MNKSRYTLLIIFSVLVFIPLTGVSQDQYERSISYSQLIDEILEKGADSESGFTLVNTEIYFDIDDLDFSDKKRTSSSYRFEDFDTGTTVSWSTLVENTRFTTSINFQNCKFSSKLEDTSFDFDSCEFQLLKFQNCTFDVGLTFKRTLFNDNLEFVNCTLLKPIKFDTSALKSLVLQDCRGGFDLRIYKSKVDLGLIIENSELNRLDVHYSRVDSLFHILRSEIGLVWGFGNKFNIKSFEIWDGNVNEILLVLNNFDFDGEYKYIKGASIRSLNHTSSVSIKGCTFDTTDTNSYFHLKVNTDDLVLERNDFRQTYLDFEGSKIEGSFTIQQCIINRPIGFERFLFPPDNSNINWDQLRGFKICLWEQRGDPPYLAKTDSQMTQNYNYRELLATYNKLYNSYRVRGDRKAANECFSEMKDLETRYLNFHYRMNDDLTSWFDWRLNQFLKFFCDYGTNPVKSIIISMWTILGFAVFYFFFYSDWDRINRAFLIRKYRIMVKYFTSEQKLEDFYSDAHRDEFKSYEDFKNEIEEKRIDLPFFFNIVGRPLYHLSLIKHQVMTFLYRRTEILGGKWTDLNPRRRLFVGSSVGVTIIIYLVYLGLVRSLNSIMLSVNTFSTLGFGDIPVRGISRYVAILEGFLGWFLLSIFSVSLISQILQN